MEGSWLHRDIVCRLLRRSVVCATGTSTTSQVLPEPQSFPQPGTTFPGNFYATKGCASGTSGVQTVRQYCQQLCARSQQDSVLPHTVELQQPLQLEMLGFSAWTELHKDYHIGYWSVISLNHTRITAIMPQALETKEEPYLKFCQVLEIFHLLWAIRKAFFQSIELLSYVPDMILWPVSAFKHFQVHGNNLTQDDLLFISLLKNMIKKKGLWVPISRERKEGRQNTTYRASLLLETRW